MSLHDLTSGQDLPGCAPDAPERPPLQRIAALESLLTTVVHDLRSPLAGIRALSEYGALASSEARCGDLFRRIVGETDKMAAILALVQSLAQHEPVAPLPLTGIVKAAVDECEPLCRQYGVHLALEGESSVLVNLRPGQLRLAIRHLVSNAALATHPGGHVSVGLEDQENTVLVRVSDDGGGIPPDLQARLFHPFVSGREGGAGLGLYAVRKIVVDQHQGEVWFETGEHGTTFFLQLPAEQGVAG